MLMNVAFWHMKHAAMIAAKDDLKIEEAKVCNYKLLTQSGIRGSIYLMLLTK